MGLYGFLIWLITFVASVLISPLRTSHRPLFESIMPVIITACAVLFAVLYFRNVKESFLQEGMSLGTAWLIMNITIDIPLFLFDGPMMMSWADYVMDIGVTYLIIPAITLGFGFLLQQKAAQQMRGAAPPSDGRA
jgi:hypothetical protein